MYVATAVLGWTGAPLVWRAKSAPARSVVVSQVNSDSRATGEYMDFLLGKVTHDVKEDCPSVIVGGGRIGSMLLDFGKRRSYDDVLVKRGDPIPADHPGPVYVCTQAADLEAVIAACPDEKKDDLVFLQDGMLEPLFQRHGIYGPTQVALWMAQVRVGGKPVDGVTPDAPQGLTTVSGKWAGAVAMRLGTGNLNCEVKMERDGRRSVLERLIFVTAYNLVGVVTGGKDGDPLTVGEVASRHGEDVGQARRAARRVTFAPYLDLRSTSLHCRSVASSPRPCGTRSRSRSSVDWTIGSPRVRRPPAARVCHTSCASASRPTAVVPRRRRVEDRVRANVALTRRLCVPLRLLLPTLQDGGEADHARRPEGRHSRRDAAPHRVPRIRGRAGADLAGDARRRRAASLTGNR
eukprot:Transcript_18766.p1 GENE.Transcript_18766~~Transcript_18766.p1  ORF type:complete len:406 (-),score=42.40 Transcript_18766:174-1391(-)